MSDHAKPDVPRKSVAIRSDHHKALSLARINRGTSLKMLLDEVLKAGLAALGIA